MMCVLGKTVKIIHVPEDKPLIAFRYFGYYYDPLYETSIGRSSNNMALRSEAYSHDWTDGVNKAKCSKTPRNHTYNKLPIRKCSCGFWAFATENYRLPIKGQWKVQCMVAIWGRVVQHEFGYRAQNLRILEVVETGIKVPASFKTRYPNIKIDDKLVRRSAKRA